MNEEEAIEYWKEKLKDYKKEIIERQNDEFKGYGTLEDIAKLNYCTLHTVLNLIERQKTEIEELKAIELKAKNGTIKVTLEGLLHLENEIKEKDKIIDNLVNNLRYYNGMQQDDIFCNQICSNKENCDRENCYYRIKEYFENKVKESK